MMEFQGKDKMIQRVQANGGMYQQMLMMQQQMLQMAEVVDQTTNGAFNLAGNMASEITGQPVAEPRANVDISTGEKENAIVAKSREQANNATQPR
jgi:hypothetical protein